MLFIKLIGLLSLLNSRLRGVRLGGIYFGLVKGDIVVGDAKDMSLTFILNIYIAGGLRIRLPSGFFAD